MASDQIIGREGFTLPEVNCDIETIDGVMTRVLGEEARIIDRTVNEFQANGQITLGDVGCGTGRALSGWQALIAQETSGEQDKIEGIGITLTDYSRYRDDITAAQWTQSKLEYKVAGLENGLPEISDDKFNFLIAYRSVPYWKNPDAGFATIRRILKPGGRLLFNALPPSINTQRSVNIRRERIMNTMSNWQREGIDILQRRVRLTLSSGASSDQLFYRVVLPGVELAA